MTCFELFWTFIFVFLELKITKKTRRKREKIIKETLTLGIGRSRKVRKVIKEANFGFPAILSTYKLKRLPLDQVLTLKN